MEQRGKRLFRIFFFNSRNGKEIPIFGENNGGNKMNTYYFTPFPISMHSLSEPGDWENQNLT